MDCLSKRHIMFSQLQNIYLHELCGLLQLRSEAASLHTTHDKLNLVGIHCMNARTHEYLPFQVSVNTIVVRHIRTGRIIRWR